MPLPAGHPPFSSFSSFHGIRAAKPLFYWLECRFVIFAIFVKTPFFWRDKSTVYQKHRFRELLPSSLLHESGTQRRLFRQTCLDELCYFGWILSGSFSSFEKGGAKRPEKPNLARTALRGLHSLLSFHGQICITDTDLLFIHCFVPQIFSKPL